MIENDEFFIHEKVSVTIRSCRKFIASNDTLISTNTMVPYIKIIEQPAPKALRFRYECEGRSAGSIPGINSTPENKTYPSVQIVGYKGRAVIVVSCVTKDPPYRPHPHNLVGKEGCKKGICTLELNNETMIASFSNLGIQCVKKKDIEEALRVREEIRVDPFRTGFNHRTQANSIDLNAVRLCFQAFLDGTERGKFDVLTPVVSEPIYDKKAMSDLCICKLSDASAPMSGGKEIILLCEKVAKDDIQVRFYEEFSGQILWESYGEFSPTQVHKQVAIAFRTPRYKTIQEDKAVQVFIQLRRPSDGVVSEPVKFFLTPEMRRKRPRNTNDDFFNEILQGFTEAQSHNPNHNRQHQPPSAASFINPFEVNRISTNSYGSRTPSPLDYQQSMRNRYAAPGQGHMSGGTMHYSDLSQTNHQNSLPPSVSPLPPIKQPALSMSISIPGLARDVDMQQQHMQVSIPLQDENNAHLAAFQSPFNLPNEESSNSIDTMQMKFKEEINELDIDDGMKLLDSKDLAELSMLDTTANLSENLSSCLILSDSKPALNSKTDIGESMTDSLTKLTDNTLKDLRTLNQIYQEKS